MRSPTDIPRGDPPLPAAAMLTGLLLLLVLRHLRAALARLRQSPGIFATLLRHAPAFAVFALAALSCGDDETGALRPDAQTRYHIADRLGSAALVLGHEGEVLARDLHDPYGAAAVAWRAEQQPGPTYRFAGEEDHALASAVTIGARQYLPALGRWASPDPQFLLDPEAELGRPGERNLYRYTGNSPVQRVDPSGYGWISIAVKLVKGAVKAAYKGYDKVDEFSGIIDDAATVVSSQAGLGSRVLSALSLASEALPISAGDIKDGYRWIRGGDRALDTPTVRTGAPSAWETVPELSSGGPTTLVRKTGEANGERARRGFLSQDKPTVLQQNREKNDGRLLCDLCGTALREPQKSMRGVTPPRNEYQRDHIIPRSKGGNGSVENTNLLCRDCNRAKGAD